MLRISILHQAAVTQKTSSDGVSLLPAPPDSLKFRQAGGNWSSADTWQ